MLQLACATLFFLGLFLPSAHAITAFNYSTRLSDYSGWNSAVRGDANTIGMAGATVALPTSIAAAESNPAGFAMATASLSAQINSSKVHDGAIQKSGASYETNEWGLAVTPAPWAFGITYYTPSVESGSYASPNTGHQLDTEVSVKEIRFNVARGFFENRLSLGVALEVVKGIRELGTVSYNNTTTDVVLGGLFRMDDHIVFGLSYIPQATIDPSSTGPAQTEMPGFNRAIVFPTVVAGGVGWIPNRFFKMGLDLHFVASTSNTALLADQSKSVGRYSTLEPRLGASYVIAEYQNFKIEYALGTYYEPSRIEGERGRLHGTSAVDINPYFINTSFGFDLANDYRNVMVSVGIDIVRACRTFDIIPKDSTPPYNGFFPHANKVSADGLPEGLTKGEPTEFPATNLGDVQQIIQDIPKKIEAKIDSIGSPTPAPKKKAATKAKLKTKPKHKKPAAVLPAAPAVKPLTNPTASPRPNQP